MLKQFDVDGVPALFAKVRGPFRAGLVFRVGAVDESVPNRGITHLLQHVALAAAGVTDDYHRNGSGEADWTSFHTEGSEYDVVSFLARVCAGLTEPPRTDLAAEKARCWRDESTGGRWSYQDPSMVWRHGARDYGLIGVPQWGLHQITEADLREWSARYFVRRNAVLWVAGPTRPAGLRLALPDGAHQPAPAPSPSPSMAPGRPPVLPATPAYHRSSGGTVYGEVRWDTHVRRDTASEVFGWVLLGEIARSVPESSGLPSPPPLAYVPRYDGRAVIAAKALARAKDLPEVLRGYLAVLADLRAGRIDPTLVRLALGAGVAELKKLTEADRLSDLAFDLLAGRPVVNREEELAAVRAVTQADLQRVAVDAYANGILQLPTDLAADLSDMVAVPTRGDREVAGTTYRAIDGPPGRLIVGAEGVSVVGEYGLSTVLFDTCVGMRVFPDGGRRLIRLDGVEVRVEPTAYHGSAAAVEALDDRIPARLRIAAAKRSQNLIPGFIREQRELAEARARRRQFFTTSFIIMSLAATAIPLIGLAGAVIALVVAAVTLPVALGMMVKAMWQGRRRRS